MRDPRVILITGASSGLGAALARAYATASVTLALSGRDSTRLARTVETCRLQGAHVLSEIVDVGDAEATMRWIEAVDDTHPIDLVIANAGISGGTGSGGESDAQAREIFKINVDGVVNTALPALARMAARGKGQLAIMSSLAAFRGLPGAPAYCASKAAVRVWGEALRGEYAARGVQVNVICPGYVETPMTSVNKFPMPFLMNAERAAGIMKRGLARNKPRIAYPWPMYALVRVLADLPQFLIDPLVRALPKKE
jgi:short-subunit dehydrogenase